MGCDMRKTILGLAAAGFGLASCGGSDVEEYQEGPFSEDAQAGGEAYADVELGDAEPEETAAASNKKRAQSKPTGVLPAGSIRVQRADVMDRNGFEKPMVATTVLIPVGWKAQGGIVWNAQETCGAGYNVNFRADAPDGASALHFFPMQRWEWNQMGAPSMPGCPMSQIGNVRQFLESTVQQARPGASVLEFNRRNDIEKQFAQLNQTTPMPMGEMRSWVEAGELLIAYDEGGVKMNEIVVATVTFNLNIMNPSYGMPGSEMMSAASFPGFAMKAPEGKLDRRIAEMLRSSNRDNPQWTARINQHNAKITSINVQGARDRARITAQAGEEIRQIQRESWDNYNESFDRNARETSEMIRGVETYDDPYHGGTVELDHTYDHAWQLNDGTYVLTDDASFNPYAVFGQDGQELRPTQ